MTMLQLLATLNQYYIFQPFFNDGITHVCETFALSLSIRIFINPVLSQQ